MLNSQNHLYIYVADRDFGFAPNPFHWYCTLATCKARIRQSAQIGDWIMGVGGKRLNATGKCIYLIKVTETMSFDEYWNDDRFQVKKPQRNGSNVMMLGDNIYHHGVGSDWIQSDSHHSKPDGSPCMDNIKQDTKSDRMLISEHYYYFGSGAIDVDLKRIRYANGRGYRKKSMKDLIIASFIKEIEVKYSKNLNSIISDPYQFADAFKTVHQKSGKILTRQPKK